MNIKIKGVTVSTGVGMDIVIVDTDLPPSTPTVAYTQFMIYAPKGEGEKYALDTFKIKPTIQCR